MRTVFYGAQDLCAQKKFVGPVCGAIITGLMLSAATAGDPLEALFVAPGYKVESIELGVPFGGAITPDPVNPSRLYVSAGNYSEQAILQVDTDTGTTQSLTPLIGNIGGLAVLNNGDLAITENMASGTILLARDLDADGAFFSPGEVTELIAPILVDAAFSGAQLAVAPAGNAAGIPGGALLVQTADGGALSEILVIKDPDTDPEYYPAGTAWFSGFTYNGGIAFTADGDVVCGVSEFPTGLVMALVNSNENDRIDSGEAHVILDGGQLMNSLSDIAVSGDDRLITSENSGTIRMFQLPADLANGSIETSETLAITNGMYLSSVRLDAPSGTFTHGSSQPHATLYVGGFASYPAATNLLAISPAPPPAAARDWTLFY